MTASKHPTAAMERDMGTVIHIVGVVPGILNHQISDLSGLTRRRVDAVIEYTQTHVNHGYWPIICDPVGNGTFQRCYLLGRPGLPDHLKQAARDLADRRQLMLEIEYPDDADHAFAELLGQGADQ